MEGILAIVLAGLAHLGSVTTVGILTVIGGIIKNIVNVLTKDMWTRFTAVVFPFRT